LAQAIGNSYVCIVLSSPELGNVAIMQLARLTAVLAIAGVVGATEVQVNPIEKVLEMLSDLQQKIISEGEAAQKVYAEFSEWCEDQSKDLHFEIKTGKAQAEELSATIEQAKADVGAADEKIEELSGTIATDEADLKAATEIREKEHADFSAEETDLVDTVDTLERAIGIIEREMAKNPALVQIQAKNTQSIVAALKSLVEASALNSQDAGKLTALVQTQQENADGDDEMGAPDPAAYKSQSGGIVDVLNGLLDEANAQLAAARKAESNSQHNFELLKLELEDAIKFANKQLDKTKKRKAAASEKQATAEGDLAVTEKGLAEDTKQLADLHHDCMTKAQDFETSTASRGEELKALATAKKIIAEATGGATAQTYSLAQMSFMQLGSHLSSRADLANFEAVKYIQKLSRNLGSASLAQLANRMAAATRFSVSAGEDPFEKVKGLITEMIARLVKEAEEDAAHKAYCDKEMSETKAKKEELTDDIDGLNAKIDQMTAESKKLKEEVAVLSKELADLAKSQAEMDKLRAEEHAEYTVNRAEMEKGVEGIKLALKVLREYYAKEDKGHQAAEGAAGGIIGMLEVVESDFSKGLAEIISEEENAQAAYEQTTKENEIAKVTKEQDVKYKTKEAKSLDKATAEATADRDGLQTELDAVLEYWDKIKEQCIAKPEPYEERKRRREAEIAGLKEALTILEGESSLLQRGVTRHEFLGAAH